MSSLSCFVFSLIRKAWFVTNKNDWKFSWIGFRKLFELLRSGLQYCIVYHLSIYVVSMRMYVSTWKASTKSTCICHQNCNIITCILRYFTISAISLPYNDGMNSETTIKLVYFHTFEIFALLVTLTVWSDFVNIWRTLCHSAARH